MPTRRTNNPPRIRTSVTSPFSRESPSPLKKLSPKPSTREQLGGGDRLTCCLISFSKRGQKKKLGMKRNRRGIKPSSKPSGDGCVECLADPKGWWFHLRRCAECGHIGCCDSSPSQHASNHAAVTGHPIITSFEPGEDWFFDYEKEAMVTGAELVPPHSHPLNQPVPGPVGRVPANWKSLLH